MILTIGLSCKPSLNKVLISTGEVMQTGANDFLLAAAQQVWYN